VVKFRFANSECVRWRIALANIKSQIKRNRQNEKRRLRNRLFSGRARTFVKKARASMANGTAEEALAATREAISALDKAAEKGVLHKNNAARRKSRLMKRLAAVKQS
jgi:small subunit ribosomal protein S20